MKHASLIACVLVAGVMQAANAQTAGDAPAKAYEIRVAGEIAPAHVRNVEYPYLAASRSQSGACDLSVKIDDLGNIAAVSVDTCSNELFRAEAEKMARSTSSTEVAAVHPLRIEWDIE